MDIKWSKTINLIDKDLQQNNKIKNVDFFTSLIDDNVLKKINPRRLVYYKKFVKTLGDPSILRKFMYTLKNIGENRKEKDKLYKKIIKLHTDLTKIDTENKDYKNLKNLKIQNLNSRIYNTLKNISYDIDNEYKENKDNLIKEISEVTHKQYGGEKNIKFVESVDDSKDYLDNYSQKIEKIVNNKNLSDDIKISKYKDLISNLNDIINPIKTLSISKEDKILFIVITFILRLITLSIINWAINTNYIYTFHKTFILYSVVYLILLYIILLIVNITYKYNTKSVIYGNTGFSFLANSLYYFYIVPGANIQRNGRILIHTIFIIIFMLIPLLLKTTSDNNIIDYSYDKKKEIKNSLNKFTLVIWFFTSIIAINY